MKTHAIVTLLCCVLAANVNAQFTTTVTIEPGNNTALILDQQPTTGYQFGILLKTERDDTKAFSLLRGDDNDETYFNIWGNGVVNVKKLYAEEVEVRPDAMGIQWPDYVFEPGYDRFTIEETQRFIQAYHHLPLLPPATRVENEGYNVSHMIMQLLETIENQSLQIIELNERLKVVEQLNENRP